MLKLDFIGIKYNTIEEREEYLSTLDSFQLTKLEYIDYMYSNENTMLSMWGIYNNYIHPQEIILKKDAMFFDNKDIENIVYAKFNNRQSTRRSILTFMSKYQEWGIEVRGDIRQNATELINRAKIVKNKSKILRNKLLSLKEFYDLLQKAKTKFPIENTIPLLLARYGICGKNCIEIANLQWRNINYRDKTVEIIYRDTGEFKIYSVDELFLRYVDFVKPDDFEYGDFIMHFKDGNKYTTSGILTHSTKICSALDIPRIAFRDLIQSRKIDYILSIRKHRKVSLFDIEKIYSKFSYGKGYSGMNALRLFYEDLTGDKVVFKREITEYTKSYILIDDNSEEYVNDICKRLNYKLPNDLDISEYLEKVRN